MDKTTKTLIIVMFASLIILGALLSRLPDNNKKADQKPVATIVPTKAPISNKPSTDPYVLYVTPTPIGDSSEYAYVPDYSVPTEGPIYQPDENIPTLYLQPTTAATPPPTITPIPTVIPTPTVTATVTPSEQLNDSYKVTFIDVGQGDCTLIQDNGANMLIDTGHWRKVEAIENVLNQNGIKTIDAIILTHPEADHIGGTTDLVKKYTVKCIYKPDYGTDTSTYGIVMDAISEANIPVVIPTAGDMIPFGTAKYEVVGPVLNNGTYYDANNSNSIMIKATHGNDTFLFTGDATGEETDDILNAGKDVSAKVITAAHHGSAQDGCNNERFWKAVNPEAVIVSCELYNRHGHPHGETLELAKKMGCKLFRTDLQGTISCTSTGNGIQWDNEPTNNYTRGEDMPR